jgi:hypothetical protein
MSKYNVKETRTPLGKNAKLEQVAITFARKNQTLMTPEELAEQYNKVAEKFKNDKSVKIRVRALNKVQWMTFKGYDQDSLSLDSEQDYMTNKVKDATNFSNFFVAEITVLKKKE